MSRADVVIIGAGIAGATLAAELAPHAAVTILEAEAHAGYHATGRSAAFWSETYGGPAVQPLTSASRTALAPFLRPLGALHIGRAEEQGALDALMTAFADSGVVLEAVDPRDRVPGLRQGWSAGVWEPSCSAIDTGAYHADALVRAARAGAELRLGVAVKAAQRVGGRWRIETSDEPVTAEILIDAAGAWADAVAARCGVAAIGVVPLRRTLVQLRTSPGAPADLPVVEHIGGTFYFKPEAGGRVWLTPHDETPVEPGDAQAEELDVAVAVDRFEGVVDWRVDAVERRWAGLRSFAPDRRPVYGFDPGQPGFFWCAGQGGFGFQTAPAAARMAADLLLGRTPALDPAPYAPDRFGRAFGRA